MQIGESVCVAISGQEAGVEAAAEEVAMNDGYCSLSCETFLWLLCWCSSFSR